MWYGGGEVSRHGLGNREERADGSKVMCSCLVNTEYTAPVRYLTETKKSRKEWTRRWTCLDLKLAARMEVAGVVTGLPKVGTYSSKRGNSSPSQSTWQGSAL